MINAVTIQISAQHALQWHLDLIIKLVSSNVLMAHLEILTENAKYATFHVKSAQAVSPLIALHAKIICIWYLINVLISVQLDTILKIVLMSASFVILKVIIFNTIVKFFHNCNNLFLKVNIMKIVLSILLQIFKESKGVGIKSN